MTFLEWEIYYRHELEEAVSVVKKMQATAEGILPKLQTEAISTLVELADHVIERGFLDEKTNKWKIE